VRESPFGSRVLAGVTCLLENLQSNEEDEMEDRFGICVAFTLRQEGGYVDDPADPGGATNMGITLATYREWSDDPHLGDLQVEDMTLKTASAIYRSLYWNPLRADALPPGVDLSVFDMGVNAGIGRSARLLQQALGFTGDQLDGSIGPETLAAANRFDAGTLVNNLADRQTSYYVSVPISASLALAGSAAPERDATLHSR
jgi:lysozyme family protein